MGFTACGDEPWEPLNELITPVYLKQVTVMLNIHVPIRSVRSAVQRYSRLYKSKRNEAASSAQAKEKNSIPADQDAQTIKQPAMSGTRLDWIFVFLRGIARAGAIGLFVALILALMPWFSPDIQGFETRLVDFVQQYAIPICSALLIWYGLRAVL